MGDKIQILYNFIKSILDKMNYLTIIKLNADFDKEIKEFHSQILIKVLDYYNKIIKIYFYTKISVNLILLNKILY